MASKFFINNGKEVDAGAIDAVNPTGTVPLLPAAGGNFVVFDAQTEEVDLQKLKPVFVEGKMDPLKNREMRVSDSYPSMFNHFFKIYSGVNFFTPGIFCMVF